MTQQEIAGLGPAFAGYLGRYRECFGQARVATHFGNYCRGLLSDLPRKTVEPIALACGTAARTLQEFLVTANWDHESAREQLQRHLAGVLNDLPDDGLGTVGVIDETSANTTRPDHAPIIEEIALMVVSENWIPYESAYEKRLVDVLARIREQSTKGLRYNMAFDQPMAAAMFLQRQPSPVALYIVPPTEDEKFEAALGS